MEIQTVKIVAMVGDEYQIHERADLSAEDPGDTWYSVLQIPPGRWIRDGAGSVSRWTDREGLEKTLRNASRQGGET